MREVYSNQLALAVGVLIVMVTAIFALIQSPETLSAPERISITVPHPVEGRKHCDTCHGIKGTRSYPIKHLGWSNESCMKCHLLRSSSVVSPAVTMQGRDTETKQQTINGPSPLLKAPGKASPVPHPLKGLEDCVACHDVGGKVRPAPADHIGWQNDSCYGCHPQAAAAP